MNYKITPKELNERLKWGLYHKEIHAACTFLRYYIKYRGQVYLGFSGGKDSQMLRWIIDQIFEGRWKDVLEIEVALILIEIQNEEENEFVKINGNTFKFQGAGIADKILGIGDKRDLRFGYKKIIQDCIWGLVPNVFCDTGLEFPELRKHVEKFPNTTWMRPLMKFPDVIKNIGVAVGSKNIATQIRRLKGYLLNPSPTNAATARLYATGIKKDGAKSKSFGIPKKWLKLLDAPFKTSDKCCDIFKKEPFRRYEKETGRHPITATTVVESLQRRSSYLSTGCNSFESGKEMSRPLSIFTEENIWEIANREGIIFCEVYYDRWIDFADGKGGIIKIFVLAEKRTGCMFCLFGIHLESKKLPNRFQRMAFTHPKQYNFMLFNCELATVLDFIGVDYKARPDQYLQIKKQYALPI